jgi:probable HAF family extracellular repeat protein
MVGLGDLAGGPVASEARASNDNGTVLVGYGATGTGITDAMRWTQATGMVSIGKLPGGSQASAEGVNSDGSVIVGWSNTATPGAQEAFRWTQATGMVSIGDLPTGSTSAVANDVSGDGSIIVGYGATSAGTQAFYWTQTDGMLRLWDVLLAHGVDPAPAGRTNLTEAWGVSDDGLTVAGTGVRNGNNEAFLAVLPEPTALALLALATPAVIGRRRRQ